MTEATYAAMREFIKVSVELEVSKAVAGIRASLPVDTRSVEPIQGPPAPPGKNGRDGIDGKDGKDGAPGKDGKLGEKGIDGRDGRDGKDGIASLDDLRAAVAKAVNESVDHAVLKQVAKAIDALPILQYEGVFREGTTYKAGECVTWGGSVWHANAATQEKPGEGKTAWTLMVKRGDKGKDAT